MERDSARRLRGYDDRPTLVEVKNPKTGKMERVLRYDYRELVPLLRHRYEPNHPEVRRVLDRPRDVRMSIDARLEVKVGRDPAQAVAAGRPGQGRGRGDGPGHRRPAGRGQLSRCPSDGTVAADESRTPIWTARATASIRRARHSKW